MTNNTIVYVSNPYYYDLYKMIVKNVYIDHSNFKITTCKDINNIISMITNIINTFKVSKITNISFYKLIYIMLELITDDIIIDENNIDTLHISLLIECIDIFKYSTFDNDKITVNICISIDTILKPYIYDKIYKLSNNKSLILDNIKKYSITALINYLDNACYFDTKQYLI